MKFTQYLPDYAELSSSNFYAHPTQAGGKRLTLAVDHIVSGEVGGRDRVGISKLRYDVDFPAESTATGNMVNKTSYYVGVQSSDYLAAQYEAVRSRTGYAAQHFDTGRFDLCSFLFVLGAAQMAGAAHVPLIRTGSSPTYRTLSTGFSIPGISELGIGPEMFKDSHEFLTLVTLAGSAGVRRLQLLTDLVPGESATLLTGDKLARYALKLAANVLYAANSCGVFGCHYAAYVQGMLSVANIASHSPEGGWVRALLTSPDYARPTGTIFGIGREFAGLPLQEKLPAREMLRTTLGQMFEALALLPVADLEVNGEYSVVVRDAQDDGRVNDYPELPGSASLVLHEWRGMLSDLHGAHRDGVNQRSVFNEFYCTDDVHPSFSQPAIVPWYYFEPTPFLTRKYERFEFFARLDEIVTLPLFRTDAVSHDHCRKDRRGRLAPGTRVFVRRTAGDLRMEGFSYLFSGRYCTLEGTGELRNVPGPANCGPRAAPMFADPSTDIFTDQRSYEPNCPVPGPREFYTVEPQYMEYKVGSVHASMTPSEIATGSVESRFGPFHVLRETETSPRRSHRHIPQHVLDKLMEGDYYSPGLARLQLQGVLGDMGSLQPPRGMYPPPDKYDDAPDGFDPALKAPPPAPNLPPGTHVPSTGAVQPTTSPPVDSFISLPEKATTTIPPPTPDLPSDEEAKVTAEDTGVKKTAPTSNVRKDGSPPDSEGGS